MNRPDLPTCRVCGDPLAQSNERTCGVCTACIQKSHDKSTVIPTPGYRPMPT